MRESLEPRNEVGYYRNLHYVVIIKRRSARRSWRGVPARFLVTICNTRRPSPLCPASLHLLLLTLPWSRLSPSGFAVPSLVPPLRLPSSLIKGSNYATSSRFSFSGFLPISFPPPPPPSAFSPPRFSSIVPWANETGAYVHEALNAEYELSSKLNRRDVIDEFHSRAPPRNVELMRHSAR